MLFDETYEFDECEKCGESETNSIVDDGFSNKNIHKTNDVYSDDGEAFDEMEGYFENGYF